MLYCHEGYWRYDTEFTPNWPTVTNDLVWTGYIGGIATSYFYCQDRVIGSSPGGDFSVDREVFSRRALVTDFYLSGIVSHDVGCNVLYGDGSVKWITDLPWHLGTPFNSGTPPAYAWWDYFSSYW
jgi:prepilin-type processing-associated H-X9-DG protein